MQITKTSFENSFLNFCGRSKAEYVRAVLRSNFADLKPGSRSINGGQVGNRHALKRGFRMWDHSGKIIDRGTNPVERESYSPDF